MHAKCSTLSDESIQNKRAILRKMTAVPMNLRHLRVQRRYPKLVNGGEGAVSFSPMFNFKSCKLHSLFSSNTTGAGLGRCLEPNAFRPTKPKIIQTARSIKKPYNASLLILCKSSPNIVTFVRSTASSALVLPYLQLNSKYCE